MSVKTKPTQVVWTESSEDDSPQFILNEFRHIPEVKGWFASDRGEIISVRQKPKIVAGRVLKSGYVQVGTSLESTKLKMFRRARLICRAFHGDPPTTKHTVDHINNIRIDDRPLNLRWLTIQENIKHSVDQGRRFRKLDKNMIKSILQDYEPWNRKKSGSVVAKKYGVHRSTILLIYKKYYEEK